MTKTRMSEWRAQYTFLVVLWTELAHPFNMSQILETKMLKNESKKTNITIPFKDIVIAAVFVCTHLLPYIQPDSAFHWKWNQSQTFQRVCHFFTMLLFTTTLLFFSFFYLCCIVFVVSNLAKLQLKWCVWQSIYGNTSNWSKLTFQP